MVESVRAGVNGIFCHATLNCYGFMMVDIHILSGRQFQSFIAVIKSEYLWLSWSKFPKDMARK